MAKDNNDTTPKPITKKHEARIAKEKRQNKVLLTIVIAVLALVVLVVTYGILDNSVFKYSKPVAKVNNTTISVRQFQKRVQYERLSQVEYFTTYASSAYAYFFQSYLVQMQNSLDDYLQFGSDMLDTMINEAVLVEKAKELGITVTEEDIDKEIERGFGYFPNGTPTAEPTIEYRPTSTFSPTQLALVTLTPIPTLEPTATLIPPTSTVDQTPVATTDEPVEGTTTEEAATATATLVPATATPEATATSTPAATEIPATATPYTKAGFDSRYQGMISSISENFEYTDADFRDYVRSLLMNQKMFDYINKDVSRDQEMVWARHILVGTEEEALAVRETLLESGDWTTVAAESSIDSGTASIGGDLGWFTRNQMVEAFENVAFSLEIGEISEPVQSDYGYHIIQVLGHEVRQLTDEEFDTFKNNNYSKFIEEAKAEMDVKKYDRWASFVPSTPAIPDEYRIDTTTTSQ